MPDESNLKALKRHLHPRPEWLALHSEDPLEPPTILIVGEVTREKVQDTVPLSGVTEEIRFLDETLLRTTTQKGDL